METAIEHDAALAYFDFDQDDEPETTFVAEERETKLRDVERSIEWRAVERDMQCYVEWRMASGKGTSSSLGALAMPRQLHKLAHHSYTDRTDWLIDFDVLLKTRPIIEQRLMCLAAMGHSQRCIALEMRISLRTCVRLDHEAHIALERKRLNRNAQTCNSARRARAATRSRRLQGLAHTFPVCSLDYFHSGSREPRKPIKVEPWAMPTICLCGRPGRRQGAAWKGKASTVATMCGVA